MKKILVIQTAFIGDAILASCLLENLKQGFPEAKIQLLVRKGNASLYENHPFIDKLWVWDKSRKYPSMFSLISEFRKEKLDWVINLQRFASSGIMTVLSGAKLKSGFSKNPLSSFYHESLPHELGKAGDASYLHEVDRNNSIIQSRTEVTFKKPKLYPSAGDKKAVESFVTDSFVTISPSSVWFTKQWPKSKWVQLIKKHADKKVYLLGSPADSAYLDEIRLESNTDSAEVLAGKLSLLQSAALMKHADMNYVNDSAPMHLASSVNAPTTAIYCSTIPEFGFGPLSDDSTVWQTAEKLDCRPCGLHGFKACPKEHFNCAEIKIPQ